MSAASLHSEDVALRRRHLRRRHPAAGICLAFVLGTWFGLRIPLPEARMLAFFALCTLVWIGLLICEKFFFFRRREILLCAALALCGCAFFTAALRAQNDVRQRTEDLEIFRELTDGESELVLCGQVLTECSFRKFDHGGARIHFSFLVSEIPRENDTVQIPPAKVEVDWYGPQSMGSEHPPFPLPRAGEGWQISGALYEKPTRSGTPLLVFVHDKKDAATHPDPVFNASPFRFHLWRIRDAASEALGRGCEKIFAGTPPIVRAMVLGCRSDVPEAVNDAFKASGTVHVFAISGLHVSIVALLVIHILLLLRLPLRAQPFALVPLLICYVVLTGARPSAIRACTMTLLVACAAFTRRSSDVLTSLWVAAALILACQPNQLYDLGFIFSFICTAGLILLVSPVETCGNALLSRIRKKWGFRNPEAQSLEEAVQKALTGNNTASGKQKASAPRILSRNGIQNRHCIQNRHRIQNRHCIQTRHRRLLQKLPHSALQLLYVSIATWLVSAPLSAFCFGRLSPVAMLCNIAIIPLAGLVIPVAALSLFCAAVLPSLSIACNLLNGVFSTLMIGIATLSAKIPGGALEVTPWEPWAVALWYGILFLIYLLYSALRKTEP